MAMFENYSDIVTVEQLAEMLKIGRNTAYQLVRANIIQSVRVGRKYIIPKLAIIDFVNSAGYNNAEIINGRQTSLSYERTENL